MARETHQKRAQVPKKQLQKTFCSITALMYVISTALLRKPELTVYCRPVLFVITIVVPFFLMMGESSDPKSTYLKYSTVTGYFEQDDPKTEARGYDFVHYLRRILIQEQ
jgi:hypothetical protein